MQFEPKSVILEFLVGPSNLALHEVSLHLLIVGDKAITVFLRFTEFLFDLSELPVVIVGDALEAHPAHWLVIRLVIQLLGEFLNFVVK